MTVNFQINFREDVAGEAGNVLENDIINLGDSFFVEIVGGDFRSEPTGLMSTLFEITYDPEVLQNLDDFESLESPILTSKFAAVRLGVLEEEAGLITVLGGGSLPSWGIGEAVGIGELEPIALLHFDSLSENNNPTTEIDLTIDLNQTNFAGGISVDPDNNDDFLEKTVILNTPPSAIALNDLILLPEDINTNELIEVATISVSDPDEDDVLTFSLTDGSDADKFRIEDNQLILEAGVSLDFEQQASLEIEITARDRAASISELFTIPVENVNEPPSALALSNQLVAEDADTTNPFPIGNLSASDPEGDALNFTITGGENANQFIIQEQTLFLATGVTLDFQSQPILTVEVTANDGELNSIPETFNIEVQEVNFPPSDITLDNQEIPENTPTPTRVGILDATDPNVNDIITFEITGGEDADKFRLEENALLIVEGVILDHETQDIFNVEITATDRLGETRTENFEIRITNINEPPSAITLSNQEIPENTNTDNGALVGDLTATDPDSDTITFSIISGENPEQFEIRDNQLFITSGVNLDHETQSELAVEINARDGEGESISELFIITITDIDEPPEQLELEPERLGIGLNSPLIEPILIGSLSAIDPEGEEVTFSLSGGEDRSRFLLSENRLFILLRSEIDFNENKTLDVEITASDPQDLNITELFSVPILDLELSNVTFPENINLTEPVATILLNSEGFEDAVTYDIVGGRDAEKFFIVGEELFLDPQVNLNPETQPVLEVEIQGTDSLGGTFSEVFTLTVLDISEVKNIHYQVISRSLSQEIFEVGLILLNEAGILPQTPEEKLTAIKEGVSLFSVYPRQFENGEVGQFLNLRTNDLERIISVPNESQLSYYLIKGNNLTSDTVDLETIQEVQFNPFRLELLADKILFNNPDLTFLAEPSTNKNVPLGANLQAQQGLEVFDLRDTLGEVTATLNFDPISVAAFEHLISFYIVDQPNGQINNLLPGDDNYLQAILDRRLQTEQDTDIFFTKASQQGLTFQFPSEEIIVPFIISNSEDLEVIPDQITNLPENSNLYTPFLETNLEGTDHFRLLADNTFGIEDLPKGGDNDFNDLIFELNFSIADQNLFNRPDLALMAQPSIIQNIPLADFPVMDFELDIQLRESLDGTVGAVIENETIFADERFFVEILLGDLRENATGIISAAMDIQFDSDIIINRDEPFISAEVITEKMPILTTGEVDNVTGLISNLGGSSLPAVDNAGSAIGLNELERFALLEFEAISPATLSSIDVNIDLGQTGFADGTFPNPDSESAFSLNLTVAALDIEDASFTISEGVITGKKVGEINLRSANPEQVSWEIINGNRDLDSDNNLAFRVSPNGELIVNDSDDLKENYSLEVRANDSTLQLQDTATVTITVTPNPFLGTLQNDILETDTSRELIFLGNGEDQANIVSDSKKTRLYGGNDNDILTVTNNARAFGNQGDDQFLVNTGGSNNRFYGGEGNDRFFFSGNNFAVGGDGIDQFFSSIEGGNTLQGGGDPDFFWVANGALPNTRNTIRDYRLTEDIIGFAGVTEVTNFSDLELIPEESDTVIRLQQNNQDIAILEGIEFSSLSEDNFLFLSESF